MSPNLYRHPCARLLSYAAAPLLLLAPALSHAQTNPHRTRMLDYTAWIAKYGTRYSCPYGFASSTYSLYYYGANYNGIEQVNIGYSNGYYNYSYLVPLGDNYHLGYASSMGQVMDAPFTASWNTLRNTGIGPDADQDGLPDKWETLAWPGAGLASQDKHGDPDLDGITNLAEYRRGTSPVWPEPDYADTGGVSPAGALPISGASLNGLPDSWETALWLRNPAAAAARGYEPLAGRYPLPPASVPGGDADNDGLHDWWEVQNFGGRSKPEATYSGDPDGDGVPNWLEYLFSTPPMNPVNCPEDPALTDPLEILSCRLTGTSWGMGALAWTGAPRWIHEGGADTDADTLPDLWEIHQSWRRNALPATATISQRLAEWQETGDPDNDTYPNWLEYRLSTPAFSASNYPDPSITSPLDILSMKACGLPWNPGAMGRVPQKQQRLWRILFDSDADLLADVWEAYYGWLHRSALSSGFSASTGYEEYVSFCENASDWNGNGVPAVMEAALGWDPLSAQLISNSGMPEYFSHEAVARLRLHFGLPDIGAALGVQTLTISYTKRDFYNPGMMNIHDSMGPLSAWGAMQWVDSDWDGMHDYLEVWYRGGIEGEPEENRDVNGARDILDCWGWTITAGMVAPEEIEFHANGYWPMGNYCNYFNVGYYGNCTDDSDPDGDNVSLGEEYNSFILSCGFSAKDMYPVDVSNLYYLPNTLPAASPSGLGPRPWLVPPPPPSGQ